MSIPKLNSSNYALWRPLIDIELDKGGKSYWFEVTEPSEAKEKRHWHTACLDAATIKENLSPEILPQYLDSKYRLNPKLLRRFSFVLWLWELCWASCGAHGHAQYSPGLRGEAQPSYIKDFDNEILMSLILSNTNRPELVSAVLASNPTSVEDVNKQFSQNEGLRDASASVAAAAAAMRSSGTSGSSPSSSDAPCLLCDGNHSTKACYKLAIGRNAVKSAAKGKGKAKKGQAAQETDSESVQVAQAAQAIPQPIEKAGAASLASNPPSNRSSDSWNADTGATASMSPHTGPALRPMGWKVWDPVSNDTWISHDVQFDESDMPGASLKLNYGPTYKPLTSDSLDPVGVESPAAKPAPKASEPSWAPSDSDSDSDTDDDFEDTPDDHPAPGPGLTLYTSSPSFMLTHS
ncbi:hypothetical protein DL93DRAFT_2103562 [Clavulina sp. PMI_390]|nr:hypothetical protein DL93DRAFT_2103562 [Clavulina sp. PMI_390]